MGKVRQFLGGHQHTLYPRQPRFHGLCGQLLDLDHAAVQVTVQQVLTPVHKARPHDHLPRRGMPCMRRGQFKLELARVAFQHPHASLGLCIQRQDAFWICVHPPVELDISAIIQPLPEGVLAPPEATARSRLLTKGINALRFELFNARKGVEAINAHEDWEQSWPPCQHP